MGKRLDQLRKAGVIHPTHKFTKKETETIESITPAEANALIRVKKKLGRVAKKKDVHSDTFIL